MQLILVRIRRDNLRGRDATKSFSGTVLTIVFGAIFLSKNSLIHLPIMSHG